MKTNQIHTLEENGAQFVFAQVFPNEYYVIEHFNKAGFEPHASIPDTVYVTAVTIDDNGEATYTYRSDPERAPSNYTMAELMAWHNRADFDETLAAYYSSRSQVNIAREFLNLARTAYMDAPTPTRLEDKHSATMEHRDAMVVFVAARDAMRLAGAAIDYDLGDVKGGVESTDL